MNKTVTVNISGIIFYIEELAYERLQNYLEAIRSYFEGSVGGDEIMADIELRIAELFQQRLNDQKQVIILSDVEEIITIMGEPEAYAEAGEEEDYTHHRKYAYSKSKNKRVYRDTDDKVIAGVCSGVANYFGWDPIIIRVVFLIMFFFYGTGVLLYIILAIIIPPARTTAQKLEMKGDPVTAENIGRKVNESFENVKKNFNKFTQSPQGRQRMRKTQNEFSAILADILNFLGKLIRYTLQFIGKFIGVILLITGIILLCFLLAITFGWENLFSINSSGFSTTTILGNFLNMVFTNNTHKFLFLTGTALVTIIPVIGLLVFAMRMLVNFKNTSKGLGLGLISLWIIGFIILTISGVFLAGDFKNKVEYREKLSIEQPISDTLYIDIMRNMPIDKKYVEKKIIFDKGVTFQGFDSTSEILIDETEFTVEQNYDTLFMLSVELSSRGATQKEAIAQTEKIIYEYEQIGDSLLFNSHYTLKNDSKLRGQELKYILSVPKGKAVYFNRQSRKILEDIPNVHNTWDGDMIEKTWIMTNQGLNCIKCGESINKND